MKNISKQIGTKPGEIAVGDGSVAEHLVEERFDLGTWIQERVKDTPWWGISIAFHLIVLLIFAAIMMSPQSKNEPTTLKIIRLPFREPKQFNMENPTSLNPTTPISKEEPSIKDPVWKRAETSDHHESDNDEDERKDKGESYEFLSESPLKGKGVYGEIGVGGGAGGDYGGHEGSRRRLVPPGGGGGPPTEGAVTHGLMWLARHQNPDGSWGARSFQNQCQGTRCSGTGSSFFDIGLTGLALLTFTGATYTPGSRDVYDGICYGAVVRKAALYLKDIQRTDGAFGPPDQGKFMYNHAVASYALADLVTLMQDKGEIAGSSLFKNSAQKAIDFLVSSRNPGWAWRYTPKSGDNDASVTGWCAMALKVAEEGGLNVPEEVWEGIKNHLDKVTDPAYGSVGYLRKGGVAVLGPEMADFQNSKIFTAPALTAVGIMMRIFMGEKRSSGIIRNAAGSLLQNLPTWDTTKRGKIDYYYWFYGSYALNQYDGPKGPAWTKWNEAMKDVLLKHQRRDGCANGSWDPIDRWSDEGGRVYATAISVLTLEVYYRLRIVMGE